MSRHAQDDGNVPEIQLTIPDVVAHLQDILQEVEISRTNLTNPTAPWVQSIYYKMLLEFGFSEKMLDVHSYSESRTSVCEHPEVFQQTVPLYKLLAACRYFLGCISHQERVPFGLMDLIDPEPKRTKRFLASMVNFWQFSNFNYAKVSQVRESVLGIVEEKGRLHSDIAHLNEKIEKILMSNAEDSIKEKNVNMQVQEMESHMAEVAKEMEGEEQGLESLRSALMNVKENESKIEAEMIDMNRKEDNLRMLLKNVDINKEMEYQLEQLKDERDSKANSEKGALDKKIYGVEERIKEIKSLTENIANFGNLHKQVKTKSSDRRAKDRETELLKTEVNDIESRILLWKKKNADLAHLKATLLNKWKKKKDLKGADLKRYQEERQELTKGFSEEEIVACELKTRLEGGKRMLTNISHQFDQQNIAFEQEYARLLEMAKLKFDEILGDIEIIQDAIYLSDQKENY